MHTIRISIRLVKRKIWAEKHPLSPPAGTGENLLTFPLRNGMISWIEQGYFPCIHWFFRRISVRGSRVIASGVFGPRMGLADKRLRTEAVGISRKGLVISARPYAPDLLDGGRVSKEAQVPFVPHFLP